MKVLFAVSNDNITTSVVSKYQQTYKEIITSKNVYYFNAIIKELQNDKTYDAIVIGEDLEPVANNNYEAIDKFLIEKLDRISDEASKPTGEDIPIIFICAERRTKSSQLLLRLFSMSIYDALVGNDRSVNKVCALINKPRSKKEAKRYYQIETDQAEYEAENEELVSEDQIQNILNYYKKIGTNERKCVEAFDSIAKQYDDTQLRIIVKFLPMQVKAILEINSQTYQQLMTGGTVLSNGKYNKYKPEPAKNQGKLEFLEKDLEKTKLSEPVVIPETMNLSSKPVSTNNNVLNTQNQNVNSQTANMGQQPNNAVYGNYMNNNNNLYNNKGYYNLYNQQRVQNTNLQNSIQQTQKIQNPMQQNQNPQSSMQQNQNTQNAIKTNTQYNSNLNNSQYNSTQQTRPEYNTSYNQYRPQESTQKVENANTIANDIENTTSSVKPEVSSTPTYENNSSVLTESTITPPTTISENNSIMTVQPVAVEPVKRGRGRPRKTPLTSEENINATSEAIETFNSSVLPGMGNTSTETNDIENILPGIENETSTLPGVETVQENTTTLPGVEPIQESTVTLPEINNEIKETPEVVLPGIEEPITVAQNKTVEEKVEDTQNPAVEQLITNTQNNETEAKNVSTETMLPGVDERSTESVLPGIEDNIIAEEDDNVQNILPGIEENNSTESTLPIIDEENLLPEVGENNNSENVLPGIEEINNNETSENTLPKVDEINKKAQEENNNSESENGEDDMNNFNQNPYGGNNGQNPYGSGMNNNQPFYKMNNNNFNQNPYGGNNGQNPYGSNNPQSPYGNGIGYNPQNPYGNGMGYNPQNPYGNGMGYNPQNPYGNGMNGYNPQNPYDNGMNNNQNPFGNEQTNNQEQTGANNSDIFDNNINPTNDLIDNIEPTVEEPAGLVAKNGKIALFVGTTKNGTSFIVNNLASILSENGINTAILDLTKNRNAYYMFTDNKADLMQVAANSLKSLQSGEPKGIAVNKNLTVFTGLPDDNTEMISPNDIIQNVSSKYDLILLDCDFDTDQEYYRLTNEIYLVQSMDAFTIQPLTKLLSDLKNNNMLDENKLRIIINKYIKTSKLDTKMIIGGLSKYNEPSMTLQRDIFNPDNIKSVTISFEEQNYIKYIEDIAMCHLSLNGYTKGLIQSLDELKNIVYPLIAGNNGGNTPNNYNNMEPKKRKGFFGSNKKDDMTFSNDMNNTLNKMRTNY